MEEEVAIAKGRKWVLLILSSIIACGVSVRAESPFAVRVVEYAPAPGQFVNNIAYGDPAGALGPPIGEGTLTGNNTTVVTLGGFGGTITLGFDHMVEDHPLNFRGLDAIVFGNAFWFTGDSNRHWAECGVIEISRDANGNGLADDPWYLIPGSHLFAHSLVILRQPWDDNPFTSTPPALASWIPLGRFGHWESEGFLLPPSVFGRTILDNPAKTEGTEGIFGVADYSPTLILGDLDGDDVVDDTLMTAEDFYTIPDDPISTEMTAGSGGGDAFDIAWAIDPNTGEAAHLTGFDFIRITNAVHVVLGPLGEVSTEIDAVADAAIDPLGDYDGDQDVDLIDFAGFQRCVSPGGTGEPQCHAMTRRDGPPDRSDWNLIAGRATGPRSSRKPSNR